MRRRERINLVNTAWGTKAPWYFEGGDELKGYFWDSNNESLNYFNTYK